MISKTKLLLCAFTVFASIPALASWRTVDEQFDQRVAVEGALQKEGDKVIVSPDSKHLLIRVKNGLELVSPSTGAVTKRWETFDGTIEYSRFGFCKGSDKLFQVRTVYNDNEKHLSVEKIEVVIYDIKTATESTVWDRKAGGSTSASYAKFSPDCAYFVTPTADPISKKIEVVKTANPDVRFTIATGAYGSPAFLDSGDLIIRNEEITGGVKQSRIVRLVPDKKTFNVLATISHNKPNDMKPLDILSSDFSHALKENNDIVSAIGQKLVLSAEDIASEGFLNPKENFISDFAFAQKNKQRVVLRRYRGGIIDLAVFDTTKRRQDFAVRNIHGSGSDYYSLTKDGNFLIYYSYYGDKTIHAVDIKAGRETFSAEGGKVIAVSPDSRLLLIGDEGKKALRLANLVLGKKIATFELRHLTEYDVTRGPILQFSEDGKYIISETYDQIGPNFKKPFVEWFEVPSEVFTK